LLIALLAWAPATGFQWVAAGDWRSAQQSVTIGNTKVLGSAALEYAQDHQGRFPKAATWCDDLLPYVRDRRSFRDPLARGLECAYAFNSALSDVRADSVVDPASVVLIFESDRGWNAAGGAELLAERIRGDDMDIYAFADGHVQSIYPRTRGPGRRPIVWQPTLREAPDRAPVK